MPRLLIAASGTGGHIYPALAFADSLSSAWQIEWLGVPDRLEIELVPEKFQLTTLKVGGLQGNIFRKIYGFLKLLFSSIEVFNLLRRKQINVVFTTGGYISAPTIIASKLRGTPVLLHESNAIPGRVTRLLGRFCDHVALGIPSASLYLPFCETSYTGTPVRAEFHSAQSLPDWVPKGSGPLILIMGGSQGATKLNEMVRNVLPWLIEKGYRVVHLTGTNDIFYKDQIKFQHQDNLAIMPFSTEIPALLQHSDLVISRAGASAICEIIISKTPSILIPFPQATDQHQDLNAAYLASFGGAIIVNQHSPKEVILLNVLHHLLGSIHLKKMKSNMKRFLCINSEEELGKIITSLN